MKNPSFLILFLALTLGACQNNKKSNEGQAHHHSPAEVPVEAASDTQKSIPQEARGQVSNVHFSIKYHSPAVRERVIWGGLVPYNEVWVTGAHSATSIEISEAIVVKDTIIPKGKYAFFTIPGKETWTLILNKNWEQHLADDYNQSDDVVRISVTPETGLPLAERLVYTIEDLGSGSGTIAMQWENLRISLPFKRG